MAPTWETRATPPSARAHGPCSDRPLSGSTRVSIASRRDNLYNSPVVDSQRNIYIAANFSDLFIVRPDGRLRGSIFLGPLTSTPVILGAAGYIVDGTGHATSFDLETLEIIWRVRYCQSNPWDSWSAAGKGDALIVGGNIDFRSNGATDLFRLSTSDGKTVWKFTYPGQDFFKMPYNMIPAITDDGQVITANNNSCVFCNSLENGELLWHVFPTWEAQFTTATVVAGRNGLCANAWNMVDEEKWNAAQGSLGKLDIYDCKSGVEKWFKIYPLTINVAPLWIPPEAAIGSSGWQVIVALGSNAGPPADHPMPVNGDAWLGLLQAHDADTGNEIWSWAPPASTHFAYRGSDAQDWYLPDAWTSMSAGSDGTIYGSFQDGVMYAVRGGELISKFDMRSCGNCAPGIAPGLVTHANQFGLFIWRDAAVEEEWAKSGDTRAAGGRLPGGAVLEGMGSGGPWDENDGRLEWWSPRPWEEPREKANAVEVTDHAAWVAETEKLHKEAMEAEIAWSEARRAERAAEIKAQGGGKADTAVERPTGKEGSVWVVVGGSDKGGIVARGGEGLKSPELGRLQTGATVEEKELKGDRLHYRKLTGDGPDFGWVSLSFKGTPLVRRQS